MPKTQRTKEKISATINIDNHNIIKGIAKENNKSVSYYIDIAVSEFLDNQREKTDKK